VAIYRQKLPGAGHATQLDAAAVLEAGARADDQVTHGAGDEDFAGARVAEDPGRDVYREPPYVAVQQFALAGVDTYADLDAQRLSVSAQGLRATDGLRRARAHAVGVKAASGVVIALPCDPRTERVVIVVLVGPGDVSVTIAVDVALQVAKALLPPLGLGVPCPAGQVVSR
jgi:hypothetical protein